MEILISLAILGIVMSALYGAYFVNLDTVESGRRHARMNQRKRLVLERLNHDLESLFVAKGDVPTDLQAGLKGMHEEVDGKPSDWMMFHTLSHVNTGSQSSNLDICKVLYHLVKNEQGSGFTLCRTEGFITNKDFPFKGMTFELERNVGGFEVSYEDEKGKAFREWGIEEGVHTSPPVLIRIRIALVDETQKEVPLIAVIHPPVANYQQKAE